MALVIGHSQAKYLSDYLSSEQYSVFSYSGYRTLKFLQEDVSFDVAPFFSVVVIVVGANDIGVKSPETIADDIECLCDAIHGTSPSATVFVSTVLPRCQNRFQGCAMPESYISHWNDDACDVNNRLRAIAYEHDDWIRVIEHPQFYTFFGSNKRLLSKDGLHLSYEGTDVLADDIVQAVQQLEVVATTETSLPHVESTRSAVQQLEVVATTASVPAMIHVEQDSPSVLGPRLYSEIVSNGSTTETSLPHVDSTRSGTSRASTRSTTTETSRRHVDSTRSGTSRESTRSTTSRRHVDSTRSGMSRASTRSGTSRASTRSTTTETSRRHVDSTRSGTSRESTRSTTSRRHVDYTRSGTSRASTRSGTSQATTRSTTSRRHVYSTSSGTSRASTRSGSSRASTRSTKKESRRHVDSTRSGTSRGSTRSIVFVICQHVPIPSW